MTIPYEGPFEWRDGRVWFRCGKCKQFTAYPVITQYKGRTIYFASCLNFRCNLTMQEFKTAETWQGICNEARNLMYE